MTFEGLSLDRWRNNQPKHFSQSGETLRHDHPSSRLQERRSPLDVGDVGQWRSDVDIERQEDAGRQRRRRTGRWTDDWRTKIWVGKKRTEAKKVGRRKISIPGNKERASKILWRQNWGISSIKQDVEGRWSQKWSKISWRYLWLILKHFYSIKLRKFEKELSALFSKLFVNFDRLRQRKAHVEYRLSI